MDVTDMGPSYAKIGEILAEGLGLDPEGVFLYAEVEEGTIASSIFKDVGDRVIYRSPWEELTMSIYDTWELGDPKKRWFSMSYTISDGKFSAIFQFPEQVDLAEDFSERRPLVLKEKYGDKPIDYSDP